MGRHARKVLLRTFGCKLNQADSAMLAALLRESGWEIVHDEADGADVVVVNTCTVTRRSEAKVRQAIRRIARENPRANIAVVGCATQLHPEAFRHLPNVRWVLGVNSKFDLPAVLEREEGVVRLDEAQAELVAPAVGLFAPRTRAFVKIQDGCRFRCSYCAVPLARGRSRSADPEKVLDQVAEAEERGFREIVLTGVDIGSYGMDLRPRRSLAWLLQRLVDRTREVRIRLSSVEPTELTDELVETVASLPRVCRHWHVPLQSGSDRVLRAMRRPYTARFFRERIAALTEHFDTFGLGSDVIVGFPGESEEDFRATRELVEQLPFTYLHVFPYSGRPGTDAAKRPDDVPKSVKEQRSRELRELAAGKKRALLRSLVGTSQEVLVESRKRDGLLTGLTDTYVRVLFPGPEELVNRLVRVRIVSAGSDVVRGEWLQEHRLTGVRQRRESCPVPE